MKKLLRILIIGVIHIMFYLWLIPELIVPRFGRTGALWGTAGVILISVVIVFFVLKPGNPRRKQ